MTKKHLIGFKTYGLQADWEKLFNAAALFKIWSKIKGFIDIPENK